MTSESGFSCRFGISGYVTREIQQKNRINNQDLSNVSFYRPPVTFRHCFIVFVGTEEHPEARMVLMYGQDSNCHSYGLIVLCFTNLTKVLSFSHLYHKKTSELITLLLLVILLTILEETSLFLKYDTETDFSAQPVKVILRFDPADAAVILGPALVLTTNIITNGNDGQRPFDFI